MENESKAKGWVKRDLIPLGWIGLILLIVFFVFGGIGLSNQSAHAAPAPQMKRVSLEDCRKTVTPDFLTKYPIDKCWEHPGGNTAFKTREDAMAHRREIFSQFTGWASEPGLIDYAIAQTDKQPTTRVRIVNGNWFNDVAEGGGKVDHNVYAFFVDVLKGLADKVAGIFLWADKWEFTYHGKHRAVFLPWICFNWADKLYASVTLPPAPPPPPPLPAPVDDCVEIAAKMNAGDTILFGIASDQDLPLSHCTAQQKPGETHFETDFREEPNCLPGIVCALEKPAADLGKPVLAGPRETFTATQNGWYIVRLPRAVVENPNVWDELFCLHFHDGHNSWGEYVASRNFTDGKAFIVFHREKVPMIYRGGMEVPWTGNALEWRFLPFAGEPNHR
jgi:hypothetical protein